MFWTSAPYKVLIPPCFARFPNPTYVVTVEFKHGLIKAPLE